MSNKAIFIPEKALNGRGDPTPITLSRGQVAQTPQHPNFMVDKGWNIPSLAYYLARHVPCINTQAYMYDVYYIVYFGQIYICMLQICISLRSFPCGQFKNSKPDR